MSVLADWHTKEAVTTQYFLEQGQGEQVLHTMRCLSNRSGGLHEEDMLQLQNALLTSRLKHHVPYIKHNWKDKHQLDTLICQAAKLAVEVPINTSTQLLTQTGSYITSEKNISVQYLSNTPGQRNPLCPGFSIYGNTATRTVHYTAKSSCTCKHLANC